jgi:hypothetical protein
MSSESQMEMLLKKIINDPALLKAVEKMEKESIKMALKEKADKRAYDRFGTLSYLNEIRQSCKLCGAYKTLYSPMIWDKIDKLYRASCIAGMLYEEWEGLERRVINQSVSTCTRCVENLLGEDKKILISKLITLSNRF